jgi:small subunit ribosomal protein S13
MRIAGITIPGDKQLEFGLTELYGVGRARAKALCKEAKIDHTRKVSDLSADEENDIRRLLEGLTLEGDLKREVGANIKRLKDISSYRGSRHAKRLPVRGQRTKTNSRTTRGNVRKTMGSGRRKESKT